MSQINENVIRDVVNDVLGQLGDTPAAKTDGCGCKSSSPRNPGKRGVFATAGQAAQAAAGAFEQLKQAGFAGREKVVQIVKTLCADNAVAWGHIELEETKIGLIDHKIAKLTGIPGIPGTEWITPVGMSGDNGITMEEFTPFGVIGAITPVTHSIPTIAANVINMVAAGNTIVFNAHPGGARCAAMAVDAFNEAIESELGIANIVTIVEQPTLESFNDICADENIALLCVTGGPGVVAAAMQSGKRAICAGPGNPPVVIAESARLDKAAADVLFGGGFDANLLCIGEKQVFVVDKVYREFMAALEAAGGVKLNPQQLKRLTSDAFTFTKDAGGCSHPAVNRELVGADCVTLAKRCGAKAPEGTEMLFAETDEDHLFVIEEQMMPVLPIVRVKDFDEAVAKAKVSEHGYKHSSMIHTLNVEEMTAMAQAMDSTLFVKNGSCLTGLGSGGEGYGSFSVATTTGEGITTPMTFTRKRRCVMVDNLNIFG